MTTEPVVTLDRALEAARDAIVYLLEIYTEEQRQPNAADLLKQWDETRTELEEAAFVPEPAKQRQRVWIDHFGLIIVSVDQGVEDDCGNRLHTVYWANGKKYGRETRPDMGDIPIVDVITLLGIER